jgi:SAM-dependent methyltransferase
MEQERGPESRPDRAAYDRYKASSFRTYNETTPGRYDRSLAVRWLRPSRMDDFVLEALGAGLTSLAILDVGCATGRLLERLAAAGARRLAGADLAPRILEVARAKLDRHGVAGDLREADTETALPWPDGTFDAVVSTGVVHHLCRPADALAEIGRVLLPGGQLVVADASFFTPVRELFNVALRIHPHAGDHRFLTGAQIRRLLAVGGWDVRRCERFGWCFVGIVARRTSSG